MAALAVSRLMRGLVIGVSTSDHRIFTAGALVMMAVAAVAAFLPAWRASAVDPVEVLRQD